MDGIHEDLNRVIVKPPWKNTPEQEAELERLPPQIASEREWRAWRERNDSLVVDYFQGQFRNRLECLTCHQVSFFFLLSCPLPSFFVLVGGWCYSLRPSRLFRISESANVGLCVCDIYTLVTDVVAFLFSAPFDPDYSRHRRLIMCFRYCNYRFRMGGMGRYL